MKKILLGSILAASLFLSCQQEVKTKSEEIKESFSQNVYSDLPTFLSANNIRISDTLKTLDGYQTCLELFIKQPLDHKDTSKGFFEQRMYLSHLDVSKPMIMETEGYNIRSNRLTPVATLIASNQLMVEHRYFGQSIPKPIDYEFITIAQQIEDYHRIRTIFGQLYGQKWLTTGFSKGGENTLIYKSKYPEDVSVSVAEVAPIILSNEDTRTSSFLDTVGTDQCRTDLIGFQRRILSHKADYIPFIKKEAETRQLTYNRVGEEKALDYAVLEFTFAFWQWGSGKCDEIPVADASIDENWSYLQKISVPRYFSDQAADARRSSNIMHQREYGYYAFDQKHVQDLLDSNHAYSNGQFKPLNVEIKYNPEYMNTVNEWLKLNGNDIVYTYGGADTWSGCAVTPTQDVNALKFVLAGGSHSTRITDFSIVIQDSVINYLRKRL